jgi:hypothetical protein
LLKVWLKAQIRVVGHILADRGLLRMRAMAVPGGHQPRLAAQVFMSEKFMSEKVVSVCENDNLRSATVNAVDALDREIDAVWGLIAIIEVLDRESRNDHYASGALRVAHNHLDALIAIRRGLGGV